MLVGWSQRNNDAKPAAEQARVDRLVLGHMDSVWVLFEELRGIKGLGDRQLLASLRRRKRKGLAAYRRSDAHGASEWASTVSPTAL